MEGNWKSTLVAATLVALLAASGCGSSTDSSTAAGEAVESSTTAAAASASTAPQTTVPLTSQPDSAIWPRFDSGVIYSDPVAAARAFATDYLGFVNPVVGDFEEGDATSGQVEITPDEGGDPTRVSLRRLGADERWWVVGAFNTNIQLQTVATGDTIESPLELTGASRSFEES